MRTRKTRSTKTRDLEINGYKCVPHIQTTSSHVEERVAMQQSIIQRADISSKATHNLRNDRINMMSKVS